MERVLIVEDDDFTRVLLQRACTSFGHHCTAVASAVEARDAWRESSFDVAVFDLDLGPGPIGVDLARVLHEENPDVRMIILTHYTDIRLAGNLPEVPPDVVLATKQAVDSAESLDELIRGAQSSTKAYANEDLSDSQVELLRLIAAGCTNAEIARRLWLSQPGVDKAAARLAQHLGIESASAHNRRVLLVQEYVRRTGQGHVPQA